MLKFITSNAPTVFMIVAVIANLITAHSILTFQRGLCRYKLKYAALAMLICAMAMTHSVKIIFQQTPVDLWVMFSSVLACALVLKSRGNVACLFRFLEGTPTNEKHLAIVGIAPASPIRCKEKHRNKT